jgi:hypothetical protein
MLKGVSGMKKIILLALFAGAVSAQETWNYTDANSAFDGYVTIAQPLAVNGTETVSLTGFGFNDLLLGSPNGISMIGGFQNDAPGAPQITFTTDNGAVTAWSANWAFGVPGTNSPTDLTLSLSPSADLYTITPMGYACMPPYPGAASPCHTTTLTGSGGAWTAAPELSQDAAALTLLVGGLLVLRGRNHTPTC